MKDITRISLAALPYNIDVPAQKELERYLNAIERSLNADDDAMREIEARIVELLADRGVNGEKVISITDIEHIRSQLGDPKDFVDESKLPSLGTGEKRLMRDSSSAVLGGVCAGLAAYFRIDVVWVRLAMIGLTLLTSGIVFLFYLIAWMIVPPARTAADRLQMAGKPVTLSALQTESATPLPDNQTARTALAVVRVIVGAGFMLGAALGIVSIVLFVYQAKFGSGIQIADREWLYSGYIWLLLAADVLATVFCAVLGYMLVAGRFVKRFWITLAILIFLGIVLIGMGVTGQVIAQRNNIDAFSKAAAEVSLDTSALKNAKRLNLNSELPISVNYNVDPTMRSAQFFYNTRITRSASHVSLVTSSDGTLSISIPRNDSTCLPDVTSCRAQNTVTIVGPMLEGIDVSGSNEVRYMMDAQDSLTVNARGDGHVSLQSIRGLTNLTAIVGNEGVLDTMNANVATISLTVEDTMSTASFATVKSLSITVPESCAATNSRGEIRVQQAGTVQVNGQPVTSNKAYPCAQLLLGEQADNTSIY